ncbi:hypothetical protein ZIOFF_043791 [Zingiber officinale]|uniref:Uncharacterized protein n=1 Tax=Zingiber officinale TaxID=94328 RepID=A0A8J5KU57_ZINOF|nr:hypothetical protein ZIOFF_043791 [Zingiber officinale]
MHKSCGEAAELGVLGFLLWISSSGMVWSLDSSKRRADSTPYSAPPPPAMKLEVEEPLAEKHVRLHKRVMDVSTSYEQALYNNVLGEPGPLGLRPNSSKRRADSTPHSTPPPPEMKLDVEEPLDEKNVCLHKRARDVSTSYEQALYNNVLGEPGPLSLCPRKSLSLADLI